MSPGYEQFAMSEARLRVLRTGAGNRSVRAVPALKSLLDATSPTGQAIPVKVELIQRRLRGGFRPFALCLSDGRSYDVPHPEFILVARHSIAVAGKDGYIDSIDPVHIVSLKDLAVGTRRKRPAR